MFYSSIGEDYVVVVFSGDVPLFAFLAVRRGETGISLSTGQVVQGQFLLTE